MVPQGQPEKSVAQKLHENLEAMRKANRPQEEMDAEIARAHSALQAKGREETKLSGLENVGAGVQNVMQGMTFGLSDDIAKATGLTSDEEQNLYKRQLEDHPVIGYGLQLAGGLAAPGAGGKMGASFLKAAAGSSLRRRAGTALAEGALQGGLTGFGSAEGGVGSRLKGLASGAGTGAAVTGGIAGIAKAARETGKAAGRSLGLSVPKLEEHLLVGPTPEKGLAKGRAELAEYRRLGLGQHVHPVDVLEHGEGALRAVGTANKAVRKQIDETLGTRANALANEADDVYSAVTGTPREGVDKSIRDFIETRKGRAAPHYEAAQFEADAFDKANPMTIKRTARGPWVAGGTPGFVKKLTDALNDPDVQRAIGSVKKNPTDRTVLKAQPYRHEVLDAAYKQLNAEFGAAKKALDRGTGGASAYREVQGLNVAREKLRNAILERSPSYEHALGEFTDESSLMRAFQEGTEAGSKDPALIADDLLRHEGTSSGHAAAYQKGGGSALRSSTTPNIDLGEFAKMHDPSKPIATKQAVERFKALYGGQAYDSYKDQVLGMLKMQRLKAGRGESTTVDKLIEQANGDPTAFARALAYFGTGSYGAGSANLFAGARAPLRLLEWTRRSKQAQRSFDDLLGAARPKGQAADVHTEEFLDRLDAALKQRNTKKADTSKLGRAARAIGRTTVGANES